MAKQIVYEVEGFTETLTTAQKTKLLDFVKSLDATIDVKAINAVMVYKNATAFDPSQISCKIRKFAQADIESVPKSVQIIDIVDAA